MGEKQVIITIGREFGSAGHEIAEELAKRFDLRLYDYHLLREIADEKNVARNINFVYGKVYLLIILSSSEYVIARSKATWDRREYL